MKLKRQKILEYLSGSDDVSLFETAREIRDRKCGPKVILRGLLEISNYCVNNCFYCGLRQDNECNERFRYSVDSIIKGSFDILELGIKTIVIQSGDDYQITSDEVIKCIKAIKEKCNDARVTLSLGERTSDELSSFREAGADRYLIKHETANRSLYKKLHPGQSFDKRRQILLDLRNLGYQIGSGFMVGLPGQTIEDLAEDILYLQELQPDMCGLGPFIPQSNTPLADKKAGSVELTLRCIALVRLVTENAHIPATTALATSDHEAGLIRGLNAGANVIMCDFTPEEERRKYVIYDNKKQVTIKDAEIAAETAGIKLSFEPGDSLK